MPGETAAAERRNRAGYLVAGVVLGALAAWILLLAA